MLMASIARQRRPKDAPERPRVWVETVTPAKAESYWETNELDRSVRKNLVERYAAIMMEGGWHLNGETVKFDWNDVLIDGQHRLLAIVESDTAVDMVVVRGLP